MTPTTEQDDIGRLEAAFEETLQAFARKVTEIGNRTFHTDAEDYCLGAISNENLTSITGPCSSRTSIAMCWRSPPSKRIAS
jgi:hypothetical protein